MEKMLGAYSSPQQLWGTGRTFADVGINALFLHSGRVDGEVIARSAAEGATVYAEFGTFRGDYLLRQDPERFADVTPIGHDGLPLSGTRRFLGACPSHPQLLLQKRNALRKLVREQPVAGVWLDYLHFHCDFELPDPPLEQSCFCDRCLERFARDTGLRPSGRTTASRAGWILSKAMEAWTDWKCEVMAGFASQARAIVMEERPNARMGLFSAPWTDGDYDGAARTILGQDLDRLHSVIDVLSPMIYQAKCGRPATWAQEYTRWLVQRVALLNARKRRHVEVWPIVEAEGATPEELDAVLGGVLEGGATGVLFYALPHVAADPLKLEAVRRVYHGG
jgi:hypothetical protein